MPYVALAEQLSLTDALTGLFNSVALSAKRDQLIAEHLRTGGPLSKISIDLDGFKETNNVLGHVTGDEVLRIVAEILRKHTRATDTIGREGGDEFTIYVAATNEEAEVIGRRIREAIESRFTAASTEISARLQKQVVVGASVGIATLATPKTGYPFIMNRPQVLAEARKLGGILTQRADEAMYAAKNSGRNNVYNAGDIDVSRETSVEPHPQNLWQRFQLLIRQLQSTNGSVEYGFA